MKISEMIRNLEEFKAQHGDLDCWYAVDDEGNGYDEVYFKPSKYYVDEHGIVYTDDDFDEVNADVLNWLTPICIVN